MAMDLYSTNTLLEVLRNQRVPSQPFWLQFFPRVVNFDTDQILFDKVFEDERRLAPFVAPNVQGRPQRLEGYETLAFKTAYVKIKDVVDPNMHIERLAGESLGTGSLSIEQRRNVVIGQLAAKARIKFANRNEWLAARAIIDGEVTISGEDYPTTLVDFRRDASLTGTLTGTARWSQAGSDPLADLRMMRKRVYDKTGARVSTHIFGADAYDKFASRVDLKEMMNKNFGGNETRVTLIRSDDYDGREYIGTISGLNGAGRIDIWVDTSKYVDDAGNEQFYLNQNSVVGVSQAVQGVRCFGAIKDARAGFRPMEIFAKNWLNEDPSVEYLLYQSSPLMVPKNPDTTYSLNVGN